MNKGVDTTVPRLASTTEARAQYQSAGARPARHRALLPLAATLFRGLEGGASTLTQGKGKPWRACWGKGGPPSRPTGDTGPRHYCACACVLGGGCTTALQLGTTATLTPRPSLRIQPLQPGRQACWELARPSVEGVAVSWSTQAAHSKRHSRYPAPRKAVARQLHPRLASPSASRVAYKTALPGLPTHFFSTCSCPPDSQSGVVRLQALYAAPQSSADPPRSPPRCTAASSAPRS